MALPGDGDVGLERQIVPVEEPCGLLAAEAQASGGEQQLDAPVAPVREHLCNRREPLRSRRRQQPIDLVEQALPPGEIDRPPVVGIDQAEIPQVRALVDVRHAR